MSWGEKAWQYAALVADDAFVAGAVAHLGYLGFAFAYVVDRRTGKQTGFQAMVPLAFGTQVAPGPDSGKSAFYHPSGYILMENRPLRLEVRLKAFQCDIAFADITPWDATWPILGVGYNRTQKAMGMPGSGDLHLDGEHIALSGHGLLDWTRGAPARETAWRWAAGVGKAGDRVVGWNLRTGFDDPEGVENCLWVTGERLGNLGPAEIDLPSDGGKAWRVRQGPLELTFEEAGRREENIDLVLVASRYCQPWGRFSGTYEGVPLEGFGVVEDHWARW